GDTGCRVRDLVGHPRRRGGGRAAAGRLPAPPHPQLRPADRALRGEGAPGRCRYSGQHGERLGAGGDHLHGDGHPGDDALDRGADRRYRGGLRGPDRGGAM
ncbi:MAG: hypothetical protein AVDCRST_MAG22-2955, partial [uncultured Rubrobacteraceae bacterium]